MRVTACVNLYGEVVGELVLKYALKRSIRAYIQSLSMGEYLQPIPP